MKRGGGGGFRTSWSFQNIHLREQHFQHYQGVFLHALLKISGSLRSPVVISIYVCYITTVRRFCRLPWKYQGRESFINCLHL